MVVSSIAEAPWLGNPTPRQAAGKASLLQIAAQNRATLCAGSHSARYGHFSTKCGQAERMLFGLHESSLRFRHNSGLFLQIADCRIGIQYLARHTATYVVPRTAWTRSEGRSRRTQNLQKGAREGPLSANTVL